MGEDGLPHQPQIIVERPEPIGPAAHLRRRFLARHVERLLSGLGDRAHELEHERGLADPRLAADQGDRPGDEAPAEHPVDLAEPGGPQSRRFVDHVGDGQRDAGATGDEKGRLTRLELLDQRVPLTAAVASSGPLGGGGAARGATVNGSGPGHDGHPRSTV